MELLKEIIGEEFGKIARCTLFVGGGGYFEGVQAVGDFTDTQIVLYFSRASVQIDGVDLAIGKYCDGDLRLKGKIRTVHFLGKDGAPI
jgi:hypothetical protein